MVVEVSPEQRLRRPPTRLVKLEAARFVKALPERVQSATNQGVQLSLSGIKLIRYLNNSAEERAIVVVPQPPRPP